MKTKLFRILLDVITFGVLPLIRAVAKRKTLIAIDINRDGVTDIEIRIPDQGKGGN